MAEPKRRAIVFPLQKVLRDRIGHIETPYEGSRQTDVAQLLQRSVLRSLPVELPNQEWCIMLLVSLYG